MRSEVKARRSESRPESRPELRSESRSESSSQVIFDILEYILLIRSDLSYYFLSTRNRL